MISNLHQPDSWSVHPCRPSSRLSYRRRWLSACSIVAILACCFATPPAAHAVTPESKEVVEVIDRAVGYLEQQTEARYGGRILMGLTLLKAGREKTHPKVKDGLVAIDLLLSNAQITSSSEIYTIGLAIILMCELDPEQYRDKIETLLKALYSRQMKEGAWTYLHNPAGDTSQTQYAILSLWMAKNSGFEIPVEVIERACGWLIRTQDVRGSFVYHVSDDGTMQRRQHGAETSPSLTAAGLGSLYITADMLKITDPQNNKEETGVSSKLKVIEPPNTRKRGDGISKVIQAEWVRRGMADGNRWFQQNYTVNSPRWNHYYLYGLERYQSFRELTEGTRSKTARWYDDGFEHLRKTQQKDGSWHGEDNAIVATCLSVLFLTRSASKSISKVVGDLGEGTLLGGMGLPPATSDLREKDGKLETTPLTGSVDELLRIIEDPENPVLSSISDLPTSLTLESDITKRSSQITKLKELVRAGSYQSRIIAVKALGQARDYSSVPVLLYALTDPDIRIVKEADQALRILSRKFQGVGLSETPSRGEIDAAIAAWKAWYLSVRPDAELLD